MDAEGTGKLAATFLLPEGYTSTDQIKWLPDDYLTPAVSDITIKSDDGQVTLEWMSALNISFGHSSLGSS